MRRRNCRRRDEGSYEGKGDYDVAAAVEPFVRVFPDLLILGVGVLDHGGLLSFFCCKG